MIKKQNASRLEKRFTQKSDAPVGIRTPVLALKGPRPSPLDDRGERIHCNRGIEEWQNLAQDELGDVNKCA